MSKHLLKPLLFYHDSFLTSKLQFVREKTQVSLYDQIDQVAASDKTQLLLYLTALRVFPGTPNWLMNLTFGHLGVDSPSFLFSMFAGLAAWNFIVCEAGNVLSTIKSKADVLTPRVYMQLILVGAVVLALAIARRWLAKSAKLKTG